MSYYRCLQMLINRKTENMVKENKISQLALNVFVSFAVSCSNNCPVTQSVEVDSVFTIKSFKLRTSGKLILKKTKKRTRKNHSYDLLEALFSNLSLYL